MMTDTMATPACSQSAFEKGMVQLLARCKETLLAKEKEYASGGDRYHNFRRAAEILRCSPESALLGMKTKHTVSVIDLVTAMGHGNLPDKAIWDEKIGDEINYLILLDGLVKENLLKGEEESRWFSDMPSRPVTQNAPNSDAMRR